MAPPTPGQLRLLQLHKQFDRPGTDFFELARRMLGLHSTDYWTPYLSARARLGDSTSPRCSPP